MLGVCFKAEPGAAEQNQWSYCFSSFGVKNFYERHSKREAMRNAVLVDTAADLPAAPKLVIIQPQDGRYIQGTESLDDFVHPDDAIYFFGGGHDNMSDEVDLGGRVPDALVYIPRVAFNLHSPLAGAVVLWDRYVKRGGFG